MREILFRGKRIDGKRIDNGEWVEGYYAAEPYTKNAYNYGYILENEKDLCAKKAWHVDSRTVGQFTGLTDKNGRKVFEGDICRMKADRLKGYGAIIFMGSAFVLCDKTHKQTRYYPLYPDGQFTVVGNIHDNPEMLEVTK